MRGHEQDSDLEDGEIIDETELEDISDCSLSGIVTIPEGLGDESDVDQLRKEALKSMNKKNELVDEDTEEERYRLEALKSLLKNIELEQEAPEVKAEPKKRKPKRKRKHESTHKQKKRKNSSVSERENFAQLKLLEPPSEVEKTDISRACHLNPEKKVKDSPCRSWYPKSESVLNVIPSVERVNSPRVPVKLEKSHDFIPLTVKSKEIVPSKPTNLNRMIIQPPTVANGFKSVPFSNSTQFRKVSNHQLRKVMPTAPVANKFSRKADKYKLVNRSKYVLRKPSTPLTNAIPNNSAKPKNKYSINRLKSKFPRINPKEFIIELDEEDSSKEEDSKDNDCSCGANEVPENCAKISSTSNVGTEVRKTVTEQKPDQSEAARSNTSGEVMPKKELDQAFTKSSESSMKIHKVESCPAAVLPFVELNETDSLPLCSENQGDGVLRERIIDSLVTHKASDTSRVTRNQHDGKLPLKECDGPGTKLLDADPALLTEFENSTSSTMDNFSSILLAAETNLLKIREKLVSDLDEFDKLAKQNVLETEKLHAMLKNLLLLRSMVLSLEGKIKLQKSQVSTNTNCMNSLFSGVKLRTECCSKLKAICIRAGKTLIGPSYKPPDDFEELISKKRKVIDFSKYIPPETK